MTENRARPIQFIYVGGPFGSGTTALAGALVSAGVDAVPPFFMTNDPRTPNSYESVAFRQIVRRYVSLRKLRYDSSQEPALTAELKSLKQEIISRPYLGGDAVGARAILFKMPISALCLPPIINVFDPRIVLSMRPFHEIEVSRERRGWPAHYGREGAKILYSILFQSLVNLGASYMAVGYQQLLRAPKCELERVFHFAGLDKGHFDLEAGAGFVRRSG